MVSAKNKKTNKKQQQQQKKTFLFFFLQYCFLIYLNLFTFKFSLFSWPIHIKTEMPGSVYNPIFLIYIYASLLSHKWHTFMCFTWIGNSYIAENPVLNLNAFLQLYTFFSLLIASYLMSKMLHIFLPVITLKMCQT